ncbi:hypothetical protein CTM61_05545 [Prevotella intermedia]|jgi:hypothetical protein|nr:hypothetical protein CTM61_05545 [Prevotella intermedia]
MLKLVESFSIYFYPLCFLAANEVPFESSSARLISLSLFKGNAEEKPWFCKDYSEEKMIISIWHCKSGSFTTRNNRFWNVLIMRLLRNSVVMEKYLHFCHLLSAHKT